MPIPLTQAGGWRGVFRIGRRLEESTAGTTECRIRVPIFDRIRLGGEPMSIDEAPDITQARRWFAEELRHTREHFAGRVRGES
jgi:hypothetical protein